MKGVILAGGLGTRLRPLTHITNKHLLPVYNKPMILYPLETLINSGIKEIMIVCGKEYGGSFMNFLGSGKEYGVKLSYALQEKNDGGIADALSYAEDFADNKSIAVILGDNIFEESFKKYLDNFKNGAMIFLKKVKDPERYGVPVFDKKGRIIKVEEKPKKPKSQYAQTGFYIFDNKVFDFIRKQKPSKRGELEITDTINFYAKIKELRYAIVKKAWFDAGTINSLLEASNYIYKKLHKKAKYNSRLIC
jgi:glucose-1-phosphate thymidylyltransferase